MTRAVSSLIACASFLGGAAAMLFVADGSPVAASAPEQRWEYLQLAPSSVSPSIDANGPRRSFTACEARAAEWRCRQFTEDTGVNDALSLALQRVGAEGWELVSTLSTTEPRLTDSQSLIYVFKRPLAR